MTAKEEKKYRAVLQMMFRQVEGDYFPPKEQFPGGPWLRARLDLPTIQRLYEEELMALEKRSGVKFKRSL